MDDALKLRDELSRIKGQGGRSVVVVVGGGYIGVEIASNISESLSDFDCEVRLVVGEKGLLPHAPTDFRTKAIHALTAAGVDICYNRQIQTIKQGSLLIKTVQPDEDVVTTEEEMSADLIVWTAGSQPNQLIRNCFPGATGSDGRLHVDPPPSICIQGHSLTCVFSQVDEEMLVKGTGSSVYALGDVSRLDKRVPASAQVVFQQVTHSPNSVHDCTNFSQLFSICMVWDFVE